MVTGSCRHNINKKFVTSTGLLKQTVNFSCSLHGNGKKEHMHSQGSVDTAFVHTDKGKIRVSNFMTKAQ